MSDPMTYAGVGVDYEAMDPFKRLAQRAGRLGSHHLAHHQYKEVEWSRGDSCYLYETPDCYRGHVNEGLGTKNLVADAMYRLTGRSYYDQVAIDTVAMIVNDMITVGCRPLTVTMHLAAGSSEWFRDERRVADLVEGWKEGCDLACCVWAGGETPTLKGMIEPSTVVLSGSAEGEVKPKETVIKPAIEAGDAIVFLGSSGIHANGLSLAREIATKLPRGYLTELSDGQTFGDALLQPTKMYVMFIDALLRNNVPVHYAVNITGHGWRKLMRAVEPFVYIIDNPGEPQPVFLTIQEYGPVTVWEMYGNCNMGAGFAIFVPQLSVSTVLQNAPFHGINAWLAGHVEKHASEKKVIIPSKGLEYTADTLAVR